MMHMYMWFGYKLGEFLFPGLDIETRWAFALTWIVLFLVALLFEGSKVYLAKVQREAFQKLYPYRSDERRTLLCERDQGSIMEPATSRNTNNVQVSRWESLKVRALVNTHQSVVFMLHNVVGYLLMLAVMVYNVHLLLAVVFGMMLGYFLFGTKLTRLQMQCFSTKRVVICTPECDDTDRCNKEKCSWEDCEGKLCKIMDSVELQQTDTQIASEPYLFGNKSTSEQATDKLVLCKDKLLQEPGELKRPPEAYNCAESTTPPLIDASMSSESDFFICQTRTCIQPSHYFPATSQDGGSKEQSVTCSYGAKKCPSKVARLKKIQASTSQCQHESEKEDSPSVEDVQLLRTERQGCCKKKQEPPPEKKCCKKNEITVVVHETTPSQSCCSKTEERIETREQSPQITCCRNAQTPSDSQEQIIK